MGLNEEETAGKVVGQEYYVTADCLKNSDTSMPLFDLTLHYDELRLSGRSRLAGIFETRSPDPVLSTLEV